LAAYFTLLADRWQLAAFGGLDGRGLPAATDSRGDEMLRYVFGVWPKTHLKALVRCAGVQ